MARTKPAALSKPRLGWNFRARPRLYGSVVAAIAAGLLVPGHIGPMLRAVIGWDAGVILFLALTLAIVVRATPVSMHRRAALEDQARWAILALMAGAALFSMFAVLGILHEAHQTSGHVSAELSVLAGTTILLSWVFAHTVFAVHYAHEYYGDRAAGTEAAGLVFPENPADPDYWDFLYFSFVVGMTCQVSDVQVAAHQWRRLVLAHGFVSFLYNTVVLALSINILAGLL